MKKRIVCLVFVIALMVSMCVPAFAAADGASRFYEIGTAPNVTIVPGEEELLVTYSAATEGAYYGIILVEGTDLPTRDNAIFYIDQLTAEEGVIEFNVYPKLPTENCDLTLYISSSNEDEALISIPLKFNAGELEPDVVKGDIFSDGVVNSKDAIKFSQYLARWSITLTDAEQKAADVFADDVLNSKDAIKLSQFLARWDVTLD